MHLSYKGSNRIQGFGGGVDFCKEFAVILPAQPLQIILDCGVSLGFPRLRVPPEKEDTKPAQRSDRSYLLKVHMRYIDVVLALKFSILSQPYLVAMGIKDKSDLARETGVASLKSEADWLLWRDSRRRCSLQFRAHLCRLAKSCPTHLIRFPLQE